MSTSKTQRWLDILAFLTARHLPVTRSQLMDGVPAYRRDLDAGTDPESIRRKFERDKKELLELGLPLETVDLGARAGTEADEQVGYRLRSRDFYLPYLRILSGGEPVEDDESARRAPRGLPQVELELDDLRVMDQGLAVLEQVPDFPYADEVRSARRALQFDQPADPPGPRPTPAAPIIARDDPAEVTARTALLTSAMEDRKAVSFTYHGAYRDAPSERAVHPYGLFFKLNRWYLVGFDPDRDGMRVFRLSRMSGLTVNTRARGTPDFERPADFTLAPWRQADPWSLPADDSSETEVTVRFDFPQSLLAERNGWGESWAGDGSTDPAEASPDGSVLRRFRARQLDSLLRWLLTLQGEARPVSPPDVVRAWETLVREVAELYAVEAAS